MSVLHVARSTLALPFEFCQEIAEGNAFMATSNPAHRPALHRGRCVASRETPHADPAAPHVQESAMSNGRAPFSSPCRVPLAVPGSRRIERCYALHGEARDRNPGWNTHVELVLVDSERDVCNVLGCYRSPDRFACDLDAGWRVLGWRMADGSMPYGEYDSVDPDLAQIDALPEPCRDSGPDAPLDFHVRSGTSPAWPSLLT
jgi:hypothetical protein